MGEPLLGSLSGTPSKARSRGFARTPRNGYYAGSIFSLMGVTPNSDETGCSPDESGRRGLGCPQKTLADGWAGPKIFVK
jgi:hypothetical protein